MQFSKDGMNVTKINNVSSSGWISPGISGANDLIVLEPSVITLPFSAGMTDMLP